MALNARRVATTNLPDEIAALTAAVQPPRYHAAHVAAERRLQMLRAKERGQANELRKVCTTAHAAGLVRPSREMRDLESSIETLRLEIKSARAAVLKERAVYAKALRASAGPHLAVAAGIITDAINQLDAAIEPVAALADAVPPTECTQLMRAAQRLQQQVREMRRSLL